MILAELTGRTLGNYRVLDRIGRGGMGVVYLGEHRLIGRKVAIKVLLPQLASDQRRLKRFFNEARASARVRHPSIVDVLDFGTHEDVSYLVLEYLEGETVRSRLKRTGAMPETTVRRLGRQAASALAAAHGHRIIHRDLKPENLFLVHDADVIGSERIKVLDFGIAKLLVESGDGVFDTGGFILGSPGYMAPEQARTHAVVDERADVYALGCVLFEMLCGRRAFTATGLSAVLNMQMFSPAPSPRVHMPAISKELDAIVVRMLARNPSDRFASMDELIAALDGVGEMAAQPAGATRAPVASLSGARSALSSPARAADLLDVPLGETATRTADRASEARPRSHLRVSIAALLVAVAVSIMLSWSATSEPAMQVPPADLEIGGSGSTSAIAQSAAVVSPQADLVGSEPPDAGLSSRPDAAAARPDAAALSPRARRPVTRRLPRERSSRPKLERGQIIDE